MLLPQRRVEALALVFYGRDVCKQLDYSLSKNGGFVRDHAKQLWEAVSAADRQPYLDRAAQALKRSEIDQVLQRTLSQQLHYELTRDGVLSGQSTSKDYTTFRQRLREAAANPQAMADLERRKQDYVEAEVLRLGG